MGLWSAAEEALLPRDAFCGWGPIASALLEAVAVAVHFRDVKVAGEPTEQSAG